MEYKGRGGLAGQQEGSRVERVLSHKKSHVCRNSGGREKAGSASKGETGRGLLCHLVSPHYVTQEQSTHMATQPSALVKEQLLH